MAVTKASERDGSKSERWVADWYDASRKHREKRFDSKSVALDFLAEQRKMSKQFNPAVAQSDITVRDYSEKWIKRVAAAAKERTVENYSANLKRHLLPYWGDYKVREIHRNAVKAWVSKLRETLSPGTASLLLSVLG